MSDALPATAHAMVDALAAGRCTSLQLTEALLARIAADRNHAVVRVEAEHARSDAHASDTRRREGRTLGPLDGLPMTLKDAMRVARSTTTWGLWLYRNHVPRTDATVARILREAGIVRIGRTGVPTGSFDWNAKNALYPEVRNPLDPTRSPGGSSGGAAAALAAGLTPLELGSDLGGSIRFPAHCCGVYGLRTTDGWLPVTDLGPEGLTGGYAHLVTLGPMARNLRDLDLMLEVFDAALPLPPQPTLPQRLAWSRHWAGPLDAATERAFDALLTRLDARVPVVEAAPPLDLDACFARWGIVAGFEYARGLPAPVRLPPIRALHAWLDVTRRIGPSQFTRAFVAGMSATLGAYEGALAQRATDFAALDTFFQQHGAWMLPNGPTALRLHEAGRPVQTEHGLVPYGDLIGRWHAPTAWFGTPALSLPIGADGVLPIGVQVHGPRFADRALLRFAAEFIDTR